MILCYYCVEETQALSQTLSSTLSFDAVEDDYEELWGVINQWVREALGAGPALTDHDYDTDTQVLTITHLDDDEDKTFTLAQLAEHDPRFEQFCRVREESSGKE